jgi:hypothetical protein
MNKHVLVFMKDYALEIVTMVEELEADIEERVTMPEAKPQNTQSKAMTWSMLEDKGNGIVLV